MVVTVVPHYECIRYDWTVGLKMVQMVKFMLCVFYCYFKKMEKEKKNNPRHKCKQDDGKTFRLTIEAA